MKKLVFALTVILVAAFSGQAFAFSSGDLVVSIYNEAGNEVGIDLSEGTVDGAFSLAEDSLNLDSWAGVYAGAWEVTRNDYDYWYGSTNENAGAITPTMYNSINGASTNVYRGYTEADTDADGVAVVVASDALSYDIQMNQNSNAPGTYTGFVNGAAEADLSVFDEGVEYVDLYLFHYNLMDGSYQDALEGVEYAGIIRINADGGVEMNPSEVPVPGALILLSSGLLGLIGIRRKNA